MKTLLRVAAVVLVVSLGLLSLPPALARPEGKCVKLGVIDTVSQGVPAALMELAMRPFKSYMEEQTATQSEIVNGGDALALAAKLADDKVQVGIFHAHEFAWAKQKYPSLRPIVVCVSETPTVSALLLVPSNSKAKDIADLKGKTLVVPRKAKEFCRLWLDRKLVPEGVAPAKHYGKILTPASPESGLDTVVDGKAQAIVVDSLAFERFKKERPGRAKWLKVIATSEGFPSGVIACHKDRFPEEQVTKFREALMAAKSSETGRATLELFKLSCFEAPSQEYQDQLDAVLKAYPAPK